MLMVEFSLIDENRTEPGWQKILCPLTPLIYLPKIGGDEPHVLKRYGAPDT